MKKVSVEELENSYYKAYDKTLTLWKTEFASERVTTTFGETHVLVSGKPSSPPLILLHAHEFSSTMWYTNIAELSECFRVYAVDILGDKNRTKVTRFPNTREEYADWLEEVLNHFKVNTASIVGISYGALMALNFAILRPERVGKLFIMSPSMGISNINGFYVAKLIVNSVVSSRPQFISKLMHWMFDERFHPQTEFYEQIVAGAVWGNPHSHVQKGKRVWPYLFKNEELSQIKCPVHIVVGDKDPTQNIEKTIQRAQSYIQGVTTERIKSGHFMNMETPEIVNFKILEFMRTKD
ncbi:alpha/beta hydrolase [Saccharibacillus sacchari]|uniref:Alpha/beta hydrolase n=1 Tax=Saccharibacillus sacchari TaxID=456493 RepID=A0ACC6P6X5_9BACL